MSRDERLQQLLNNPHIWKQGAAAPDRPRPLASGHPKLDALLGGGWPLGVLTELLVEAQGVGEVRLLLPVLKALQSRHAKGSAAHRLRVHRQLCWVKPPHIPYAPALAQYGLDLSQLLIVNPESQADARWAMEQALRSKVCAAVFAWVDSVEAQAIRRLQLATESTACWGVLFRPARFAQRSSAAPLRITLTAERDGLHLHVLRNRYGPLGQLTLTC